MRIVLCYRRYDEELVCPIQERCSDNVSDKGDSTYEEGSTDAAIEETKKV